MAESVINGTDLYCFIEGVAIAHATNHTLSIKTAVIPTSNKDTGLYATKIPGRSDVTVTCEGFIAYGDFETVVNAKIARLPVTLALGKKSAGALVTSSPYFTGEFIITSYELSAADNTVATYSVTFDHYESFEFIDEAYPAILDDGHTVGWYIASDLTTLTDDGGGVISEWRDSLGSGHDLVATTTQRPSWSADGILFDGTNNFMKTSNFTFVQPEFIYLVIRQLTWTQSDIIFDGSGSTDTYIYQSDFTPKIYANSGTPSLGFISPVLWAWSIIRVLFNGASSKLILNNDAPNTGNYGSNNMGGFTIGTDGNAAFGKSNIQVKEIILRDVNDGLGTDEATILTYLQDKYSI